MDGWLNLLIDRWMDRWIEGLMNRWMVEWMDGQTDGQTHLFGVASVDHTEHGFTYDHVVEEAHHHHQGQ